MEGFKYERNDRKSRASRLPCGDHADPHRGQVEGADPSRSAPWNKTLWGVKKSIGSVSQKVLTAQLRAMEENRLVHREVYAEVPPRVEYSLTELGKSLKPILDSMWAWGEAYKAKQ